MPNIPPKIKASLVSIFFLIVGTFSVIYKINNYYLAIPVILFYIILLINTYFSIKLFSKITSNEDNIQNIIDIILVIVYLLVAFNMNNVKYFTFFLLILFIVATAKYAFMLNKTNYPKLFKNKILVDISGIMACALTLGGIILGYTNYSIWCLSLTFTFANFLLFFVWPLYKLDTE